MTDPAAGSEARRERLGVLLASLVASGLVVLFSDKPFHIDDPHFLKAAEHVASDPLHPLDFGINLDDRTRHARAVFASPPGFFYFLAFLLRLGVEGERGLHLCLAPFAALLVWGTARLARALGQRPLLPAILVACSPAAIVCATTVMPDTFAGALATLGAALWLEGTEGTRRIRSLGGGLLMALASFTRYGAIAAPAALGVFALLRRIRSPVAWGALLLSPAASIPWTLLAGGGEAVSSLTAFEPNPLHAARLLAMAAHLSLAAAPTLCALASRKALLLLLPGLAAAGVLALLLPDVHRQGRLHVLSVLLPAAVGVGFVLRVAVLPFREGALARAPTALLAAWILGTLMLPVVYVHASAKYLVPALAPLALAALRMEPPGSRVGRPLLIAGASLLLGLCASVADAHLARAHRDLAERTVRPLARPGRRVWFAGHWGFQWYAEKAGARCYEAHEPILQGDLLVVAEVAHKQGEPDAGAFRFVAVRKDAVEDRFPFRTMAFPANAGFYSHAYGLLPFGISTRPLEQVLVLEVR
ncbi:MAG: glycosyltransferase family 39 protein [Planctomycetes bacterium]|nr:glycosyltransferase family 39 protein [Planctomycetota bacterium]